MIFTFGVSTYNQSEFILETLESIKYQIVTYGDGITNRLYIIDDCSKDQTVDICRKWIAVNKDLFDVAECIAKPENKGVVDSYNRIMDLVEGDYFVSLAGDDLISSDNFYEKNFVVGPKQIDSYLCTPLLNGEIKISKAEMARFYLKSRKEKHTRYNLAHMKLGCYFHSPSTIITKTLYENAGCKELNQQFRLFEDDPTWYSILKNTEDVQVNFIGDVVVLYRIHEKSISNRKKGNTPFDRELQKLRNIYIADSQGLEKKWFQWLYAEEKHWRMVLVDKIRRNVCRILYAVLLLNKEFRKFSSDCDQAVQRARSYYNQICENVKEFSQAEL